MELDFYLIVSGALAQAILLALLTVKRIGCHLSAFRIYLLFELLYGIFYLFIPAALVGFRISAWMAATIIDALLYLAVLIEIARNALRHNRIYSPSRWFVLLLFLGIALAIWPAVQFRAPLDLPPLWAIALHELQFTTLVEAAALGTLIVWSSFSKLRWPSHEFRIATGIGAWTIIALGALMLHNDGLNNHWVDQLNPTAVLIITLWWIQHFWFVPKNRTQSDEAKAIESAGSAPENRHTSLSNLISS